MNLSPFRYPGAKNRMLKLILPRLLDRVGETFGDPFVGGGSVALAVANARPDAQIILNDFDPRMSAFWAVVSGQEKGLPHLIRMVEACKPTVGLHAEIQALPMTSEPVHLAFAALYLNRTSFSGILDAGPIGGLDQKSRYTVGCRWNGSSLKGKIYGAVGSLRDRARVLWEHAFGFLDQVPGPVYLDPPYWARGKDCYPVWMSEGEHLELAKRLRARDGYWLLSYDTAEPVVRIYEPWAQVDYVDATYSINGGWKDARELLISPQVLGDESR
jgi:DNA adenine methylase